MTFFKEYFDLGDFIQGTGTLTRSRTGEISLILTDFAMLAKAISPLPAAKDEVVDGVVVRHATLADPETRYRQRYADLAVNPKIRQIFRTRTALITALRKFLDSHDFMEVETPILQPIYGGAAARPFITHHNQLKQDLYLRISFELYLKRLLVGGFRSGVSGCGAPPQHQRQPSALRRALRRVGSPGPAGAPALRVEGR